MQGLAALRWRRFYGPVARRSVSRRSHQSELCEAYQEVGNCMGLFYDPFILTTALSMISWKYAVDRFFPGDTRASHCRLMCGPAVSESSDLLSAASVHRVACQAERARSAQRLRCWIPTSIDFLFLMLSKSQPSSRVGVEIYGYMCRHAGFSILAINTADKSESDGNVPGSR